jgi:putative heme iron utilization protein
VTNDATACRTLASRARFGALATVARDPAGWPFVTLVAVSFDERGRPLLLLSRLAEHTKNLVACARASLMVSDASGGDPLASPRMTLVGECARVTGEETENERVVFLTAHPEAAAYASLADFEPWRLEVAHVRFVGGFGRMSWLDASEYGSG